MPHLTLQYTRNLSGFDPDAALRDINHALAASSEFNEIDIKSRAVALDGFRVGTADVPRAFVHAVLHILPGRSVETRRALSQCVLTTLEALRPAAHPQLQLCVEVDEIDAPSYSKLSFDAVED
jgi:5-carboxymethyl-2-hydroxymuconate isomerase